MNRSYVCEQIILATYKEGDLVNSVVLAKLAGVPVAVASAYLNLSAKVGRLELIGKTPNPDRFNARHVHVYKVKSAFFERKMSINPERSGNSKRGGLVGRTWVSKELPIVEMDGEY